MLKEISVNLGNLLLSLSDAVDLANPLIASHQMRTAFIAWQIAKAAKLSKETTEKIYIAALLHDIGALAPEDRFVSTILKKGTWKRIAFGERFYSNLRRC